MHGEPGLTPVHRCVHLGREEFALLHVDGLVRRWTAGGGIEPLLDLDHPAVDLADASVVDEGAFAVADALGVRLRRPFDGFASPRFGPARGQPAGVAVTSGTVVVADDEGGLTWWSPSEARVILHEPRHRKAIHDLRSIVLADGRPALLTASDDRSVALTDPGSGRLIHRLSGHIGWVGRCTTVEDDFGRTEALVTVDRASVRIWDPVTGALRSRCGLGGRRASALDATWGTAAGPVVALGFVDGSVATTACSRWPQPARVHAGRVTGVAVVTADADRVVVASSGVDGVILLTTYHADGGPSPSVQLVAGRPIDHLARSGHGLVAVHDDGTATVLRAAVAA